MRISDWSSDVCSSDLVAAPLAADAGNAVGVADPAQAALAAGAVVTRVAAAAAALAAVLRHRADGPVLEHERYRADLPAHARERPVARGRAADNGAGHVGEAIGRAHG